MDLDFKTVRALSSPTRIKILSQALETEATTTQLSNKIDKSKSTISSHLEKLVEAELLEKDKEEGRKRVVYRPTEKSRAIVEGRTRKVKFSVASSAITALTGLALMWPTGNRPEARSSADAGVMMEQAETQASEASYADPLLMASVLLFAVSILALLYGLVMKSMPEEAEG